MRAAMRTRITYRRRSQNRFSIFLAVLVMLVILAAVGVRGYYLSQKLSEYDRKKAEIQAQIEEEKIKSREIEEYAKYVQTDEFIEEYARDKLGLVKEGEILFKNEDSH